MAYLNEPKYIQINLYIIDENYCWQKRLYLTPKRIR
jgi:hypothetical protein